ncbi:MAG TPA: hypothetical protein PLV19_01460 [Nitrosomonas sp.]|nr:hypothetical protein [Nitrosomonas sp.]HQX12825.1 hypothetical protein [Nitrosomonas sp.]HRB20910.1 hypothetical protein [Nitrosomonas sp.]HRB32819.1 hypothetical protein [Nitrosomonas sp.]HRB45436.1 hypothetical protein [Nitrosomonas sp.]
MLDSADMIDDLRSPPPGNRLEKLSGNRLGWWSIRINHDRTADNWYGGFAQANHPNQQSFNYLQTTNDCVLYLLADCRFAPNPPYAI